MILQTLTVKNLTYLLSLNTKENDMLVSYNFFEGESPFKTVGRFTLCGFQQSGTEAVALIDFNKDLPNAPEGTAHARMGHSGGRIELDPFQLAVLVDAMPEGEEKEYLDIIHEALDELSGASMALTNLFDRANRNLEDTEEDRLSVEDPVNNAQTILCKIYKNPDAVFTSLPDAPPRPA